jgi:DNA-damage-inducible protein J
MPKKSISFPIDENLKKEAEKLFKELGISIEEALNIFIKQSIKEKGIPFRITMNQENTKENF